MENAIYIVHYSYGSYDDLVTGIAGVFDNIVIAEKLRDELNSYAIKIQKESPEKIQYYTFSKEEYFESDYWKYCTTYDKEINWNDASIETYSLNKTIEI